MTNPSRRRHTESDPQVTYWAVSILRSKSFWFNTGVLIVAILTATDVLAVVPVGRQPLVGAIVAALNIWLRTQAVRPVAFIAPSQTQPVQVPRV